MADSDVAREAVSGADVRRLPPPLLAHHRELLERSGIHREFAAERGVRSVTSPEDLPYELSVHAGAGIVPGLLFEWRGPREPVHYQVRPDVPVADAEGRPRKYLQAAGVHLLNVMGDPHAASEVWIVEGTKQALSAGAHAGPGVLVVGIPGCWNGMAEGRLLPELVGLIEDRPVVVVFDADLATNPSVWKAGQALQEALELEGATSVNFARVPGDGKAGLDDLLGDRPPQGRAKLLRRLAHRATKLPKAPPAGASIPGSDDIARPPIDVTQDRLFLLERTVDSMISRWDGWRLFNHGDVISELDSNGKTLAVDRGHLLGLLAETARFFRPTRSGPAAAWPDANVLAAVTARAGQFTPLDRVSRVPFVRHDGTICQAPGYDEPSRTFLLKGDGLADVTVPAHPSHAEVCDALTLLQVEWLGDMPLAEAADRANVLALVLTPIIRGLVPLAPLAVVDGLQMGVGKNLLADCVAILIMGENAHPLPYPSDDDELRKVITSTFGTGAELFVFDEAHSIGGRSLARALTATTYTDRILGVSQMANYPNTVTWVALGNQVQVHGDLARRVYRISLRPTDPDPDRRHASQFRHPDLRAWTRANRGELVGATLTLVRAWFAAGQPTAPNGVSFGSFEAWDRIIGGILHVAGVEGFLGNTREWRAEADFESGYWEEHLHDVWCAFGEETFTVAEVVENMKSGLIEQMPPHMADCTGRGFPRELGQTYARVKDRWYGNLRLRRHGTPGKGGAQGKVNRWKLDQRRDPAPATGDASAAPAAAGGAAPPSPAHQHVNLDVEGSGGSEGSEPSLLPDESGGLIRRGGSPSGAAQLGGTGTTRHLPSDPSDPLREIDLDSTEDARTRAAGVPRVMRAMSLHGIRLDLPLVLRRLEDSARRRTNLRQRLTHDFGFPAHTASGHIASHPWSSTEGRRHLQGLVADTGWPSGVDGHPAIDRASLDAVTSRSESEDAKDLAAIITELQTPSTFLQDVAVHAQTQRVHPTYRADTVTGRWTSTRPNVFAAGRRTAALLADRDVLLAESDHVMIGVDLAGIDARCVAGLSGDRAYADLVTGIDPHGAMAQAFFGTTDQRSAAKAITHGINYGRGAQSIAEQTGKSLAEIEALLRGYRVAYPDLAQWQGNLRTAAVGGRLATGTGRYVVVDPAAAYTTAPARVAQAAALDVAVTGLLRLEQAGLLQNLRLFLHDEVVLSVPRVEAPDLLAQVAALMSFRWRSPSGLVIPITAEPHEHAGRRWSELYTVAGDSDS
ncbi:DNA polymerase [Knoellia sp. Soil729]|uniref:DNA polymerase n=1 Tax=Knoellia sp. Soil729 TaxID=1736394 RepID=UPI00138F7463|nr:DNA polymerase [Knoellia sp. Soil729]